MVLYESEYNFLQTSTSIVDKIAKLDLVIAGLYSTAEKDAGKDNIDEYSLDDGQTKIKYSYRGAEAVMKSIQSFEKLRDMYVVKYNKLNTGNVIRLMDSSNLSRRYGN